MQALSGLFSRGVAFGLHSRNLALLSTITTSLKLIPNLLGWNYRRINRRFCMWRSSATPPLVAEWDSKWTQLPHSDGLERVFREWRSLSGDERLSIRITKEQASGQPTSR